MRRGIRTLGGASINVGKNDCIVYGLIDPKNEAVRYIGKSMQGLRRPRAHSMPKFLNDETPKTRWIRKLQLDGRTYGIVVLETVSDSADLFDVEAFWIAQGRSLGWRLLNLSGGRGMYGMHHSQATRRLLSAKAKGRNMTKLVERSAELRRGKKLSEEHRAALRGPRGPLSRPRTNPGSVGHVVTEATREKIAASLRAYFRNRRS